MALPLFFSKHGLSICGISPFFLSIGGPSTFFSQHGLSIYGLWPFILNIGGPSIFFSQYGLSFCGLWLFIPNICGLPIFPLYGCSFCGRGDNSFSTLVALPLFFSKHGLSFVAFNHSFSTLVVVLFFLAIVRNVFFFHLFVDFLAHWFFQIF